VADTVWDELTKIIDAIDYLRGELGRCVGLSTYRTQLEENLEIAEAQRTHFLSRLCEAVPQELVRERER
jgi:hypothetical protein